MRRLHQIVWFPSQATTRGHQRALESTAPVGVLVDKATIRNPALNDSSTGVRPHEQSQ